MKNRSSFVLSSTSARKYRRSTRTASRSFSDCPADVESEVVLGRVAAEVAERLRFVARLLDGEKMTALCAEFGISRKTGYKIYDRYKDYGVHGSPTAAGVPIGMPTSSRWSLKRRLSG